MASIEVSLSSTPRRRKNGSISGISVGSNRSITKDLAVKELENLRNALRDKENIIQSLKGQLTVPGLRLNGIRNNNNTNGNNRELSDVEKKQAEDRLNRLKTDVDNKRLVIKNLKMALEKLDITDNIDVRIQQAELEYQLGREELNLLTLLEEARALQLCIEESNKACSETGTLYSCVHDGEYVILQSVEVDYDPKSPKFGAGQKESCSGLWIDWALEETGLCKGDRLVEVNGKIVLTKSREDLSRLLAAAPDPAQLVVLRKPTNDIPVKCPPNHAIKELSALRSELEILRERAEETQRAKDSLRSDNIRLTHRISYLEEQVTELLSKKSSENDIRVVSPSTLISKSEQNVTNINITARDSPVSNKQDVQLFQKGPQITALVSNIPSLETKEACHNYRSKSSLSNVSNTMIPAPSPQPDHSCYKGHNRHKHRSARNSLGYESSENKIIYRKQGHHHHHKDKDCGSETNSAVEPHGNRYNRRNYEHRYSTSEIANKATSEMEYGKENVMDQSFKKATKIVHELTRSKESSSLYEKHRQKCITASEKYNFDILKHYNARKSTSVLDFRSEIHIGPKYVDSKSVEELDSLDSSTKPSNRIYRKIQDARSVKSLDFDSDCNSNSNCRPINGHGLSRKHIDYTSEPLNSDNKKINSCYPNYYDSHDRPRPMPPKKPLRLSLHKTHSLQSVESSVASIGESQKCETRKRNHKGEMPVGNPVKTGDNFNMDNARLSHMKWMNYRKSTENGLEAGSWC